DRRIDGVEPKGLATDVGDVVPRARGHEDRPPVLDLPVEVEPVLAGAHLHAAPARVEPQELVGLRVSLEADVLADGDRHEGQLEVLPRPRDRPVVPVLQRCALEVEALRFRPDVLDGHESLPVTFGTARVDPSLSRLPAATVSDPGSERGRQRKAAMPVIAWPTTRVCISTVPS